MADPLNDASTTIDSQIKKFVHELEKRCAELHLQSLQVQRSRVATGGARLKDADLFPQDICLRVSKNGKSSHRTPAEQAASVVKGGSWVCWGSHMSDKARHVILRVGGKPYYGLRKWRTSKANKADFIDAWGHAMKKAGVRNFRGGQGFASGDEFHLELPESRIKRTSLRAQKCLDEYVRLTRKLGQAKNPRFESKYGRLIEKSVKRIGR